MKGDFTRLSFDAANHYTQVLRQQGRVDLDADWNEQGAILEHLRRTLLRDVVGANGSPRENRGFEASQSPDALDLLLTPGRIYVDGLVCELEASPALVVDFHDDDVVELDSLTLDGRELAEGQWVELSTGTGTPAPAITRVTAISTGDRRVTLETALPDFAGTDSPVLLRRITSYATQPSLPAPEPLELGDETDGQTDLVIIDVWQRHVTALEDPGIREVALGGPDTTTRLETVWQVRVLRNLGADCASPDADWLPAASGGRLSSGAEATPPVEDPCDIPPRGGFRGLENRLYRVEVHEGGPLGDATWKWSRDNGSVAFAIEEFPATLPDRVRVRRLGRDQVLNLRPDDWVEILDDDTELAGTGGFLARVDAVDDGTRLVTLDRDVPAGTFDPGRQARIRRWDQRADVDANGLLTTGSDTVELEDGVEVSFSGDAFRAGDYWVFAARTATREVEPLIAAEPKGVHHHYCRLGTISWRDTGGDRPVPTFEPCPLEFPPLTGITADDVAFDNDVCNLLDAETVQDAIERLCAARDLRHHNKHLHGWGIVCGLQVQCGSDADRDDRRSVTVRTGYAIDCDGNDVLLREPRSLDVISAIAELDEANPNDPVLDDGGNGEVCIRLDRENGNATGFTFEKYAPEQRGWQALLQGTLLLDFYQRCIERVIRWVIDEFTPDPEEEEMLVGPTRRRITTFLNLLVQLWNPTNGRYVFLSRREHDILRAFYDGLRALLQSRTYCAMFDHARPFPDYPFDDDEHSTIFGNGGHSRLRLDPNGRTAYTVGVGNRVHLFDLERREMVADVEFPGGTGALVRDVAFSEDGRELYAIATLQNSTLFASAEVADGELRWRPASVVCDLRLVTLATRRGTPNTVYAVGKGTGLYSFDPRDEQIRPESIHPFNAVGHLEVDAERGLAFATAGQGDAITDIYDSFVRIDLGEPDANPQHVSLNRATGASATGDDDIAIDPDNDRLAVVVNAGATKSLLLYPLTEGSAPIGETSGLENTAIRLAYAPSSRLMVLSFENSFRLGLVDTLQGAPRGEYRHPVQISPMAIAISQDQENAYVLNQVSNTINTIPSRYLSEDGMMDVEALATYRTGVIDAFIDLLGGFLQYLKDCFCDLLLVNCPDCDDEDVIYLGCVSVRDGRVERVCNFARRKYVKSFPTVGYWLSVVPVWPLVKQAVEWFCCSVPVTFFGQRAAPQSFAYEQNVQASEMRRGMSFFQSSDFNVMTRQVTERFGLARAMTTDFVQARAPATPTSVSADVPTLAQREVVDQSVEVANQRLEAADVTVAAVREYDPADAAGNLLRVTTAPINLRAGQSVELFEQEGRVKYYRVVQEETRTPVLTDRGEIATEEATVGMPSAEVEAELSAMRAELAEMRTTYEGVIASRDEQISVLTARTQELEGSLSGLQELQGRIERLESPER